MLVGKELIIGADTLLYQLLDKRDRQSLQFELHDAELLAFIHCLSQGGSIFARFVTNILASDDYVQRQEWRLFFKENLTLSSQAFDTIYEIHCLEQVMASFSYNTSLPWGARFQAESYLLINNFSWLINDAIVRLNQQIEVIEINMRLCGFDPMMMKAYLYLIGVKLK